jgi:hypothetical protein
MKTPYRRLQLAAPRSTYFSDQAFDDLGAGCRRAEAFFAHRFAQLVVLDQFAAPSIADSSVASEKSGGGRVWLATTLISVATFSSWRTGASVASSSP